MKKTIYLFVLLCSISIFSTSCWEKKTTVEKIEESTEDVEDELEDAADEVEDAMDN